ncbi:MAG TPA: Na(+)-translocating NADH-quinone reductase subunit C, partial [Planctomycetaceae bacterium]|nr:Na(+)-translocating NADH-quinone reductase subunit C [Planctomycetaceae bacterium]
KGLWSTLYGFVAVERDASDKLNQIAGLTFYSHAKTPGLGGEVDNPAWKEKWQGKRVRNDGGEVQLAVIKGVAKSEFEVDGLSGATITSNGVTNTIQYWMSDEGFGKFLANIE